MELSVSLITMLCICLCLLPTLSASHHSHGLQSSHVNEGLQISDTILPRKLMKLTQEATASDNAHGVKDSASHKQQKEDFPGNSSRKDARKQRHGIRTWREWIEADRPEFFTMDYAPVRRRRPIHN